MTLPASILLCALALLTCVGLELVALTARAPEEGHGPVLVVAPPWSGGAASIVLSARGRLVGPAAAPFSVLAADVSPAALRAAGAWLILNPKVLDALCSQKEAT